MAAEAARNPDGWVYEIDGRFVSDPDGYVPPEAIRGGWKVDGRGTFTGEYWENPDHGPPRDDFAKLIRPDIWLGWLGDDPSGAVRASVAEILDDQVSGAVLQWMKITEDPKFVHIGRRRPDDPKSMVLTRAALAAAFAAGVRSPDRDLEILWGTYTIVRSGLDQPDSARTRAWFDLRVGLDWAEVRLRTRLEEISGPA